MGGTVQAQPTPTAPDRVDASGADGVMALAVAAVLYETAWLYALCLLGIVGLVVLSVRLRQLNAREAELRRIVRERTEALETEKETVARQGEDLAALDAARSRLLASVSHEFRTPLTLTIGPLDDVLGGDHGDIPEPVRAQLGLARRSAGRVLGLVEQILDVSHLEAGRFPLRARQLDLGDVAEAIVSAMRPLAERKGIAFSVDRPAALSIWADPVQLEKALANLLSNALKVTPEGGAVHLTVERDAETARLAIRDSEPGVPDADLPPMFDRFGEAGDGEERAEPGADIGLALAREVAALHGGALSVERTEGFGSLFVLTLPLGRSHLSEEQIDASGGAWAPAQAPLAVDLADAEPAIAEPAIAEPQYDDDITTVLVIADNAEVRAYVRRHLSADYRVLEAEDGVAGLAMAREHLPDLVLSDVMMPKMDGIALCRALRDDADTDFIPVVLLSARTDIDDRIGGLDVGADAYLTKPFDARELRARIGNLVASRQRLRERFGGSSDDGEKGPVSLDTESPADVLLGQVQAIIETHLGDDTFTVERLADTAGVSRGHLHRQLRDVADMAPSDLIRTMRLERAAQLLEADAGTIAEVAYAVGFKSVSHFSNRFDRHFGCRPSAYTAA